MVTDWSDSMERGRLYANPSGMGCARPNPSGAFIAPIINGIHRTQIINTDIPKDRRHLNHFLLTSKIIHETGSAINVRTNNMPTIISNTVGTVKKNKPKVIISKANRTGNAHQYLMMILFIYPFYSLCFNSSILSFVSLIISSSVFCSSSSLRQNSNSLKASSFLPKA